MPELIVHCPKCAEHETPKLYINAELGVFNCFRCNFKGKIKSLYRYPKLIAKLEEHLTLAEYAKLRSFRPLETKNVDLLEEMNPIREIYTGDPQYEYLLSRGWTEDLINIYRPLLSLNPIYKDRVILPIIENEKIIYYTARSMNKDCFLKYKNPTSVSRKNIIFKSLVPESILYPKDMVVLEGIFDSYKIPNGIGLLGKTISEENENSILELAANKQNLFVCLDFGAEDAMEAICKKLYSWFPNKSIFKIDTKTYNGKDLGDLSKEMTSIDLLSWIKQHSLRYIPESLVSNIRDRILNM